MTLMFWLVRELTVAFILTAKGREGDRAVDTMVYTVPELTIAHVVLSGPDSRKKTLLD